jgi:hypothetical protein
MPHAAENIHRNILHDGEGDVNVEEFDKEFLALSEEDRMEVLKRILPVFCRDMMRNDEKIREMFVLFTEECGRPMRNMFSAMATMMGHKGCCG